MNLLWDAGPVMWDKFIIVSVVRTDSVRAISLADNSDDCGTVTRNSDGTWWFFKC
jgi:hypothetical protein